MKSTVEKVSPLERRLNILVPATTVATTFEKAFKGVQKQAHIKGFRQGKAPLTTVKSVYGDRVKQDVVQELVQKHYFDAVKEHGLQPINYPEFEFDVPAEDKDFSFTAHFEVKPEITLNNYEGLTVEKEKFEADEKKVDQVLENIRAARATLVDVLEDRPAQLGDIAVVDFEGFVDGQPLEGGTGTNHNLELGAKQFIEGFEEGVVGMKVGSSKTISLKFPDPYHSPALSGKPVDFKVTLKGLKKKELPVLDDAFVAQMMGGSIEGTDEAAKHTVESLRKTIRDDMEQSEKKRIETDFKNRLLRQLVKNNPVDVPPSMLKEQKQALVEDMKKKMLEQGMSETEFETYVQKWDKDFEASAAEMIQSGFLIDTLANKLNLKWTDADLENKYEEYAKQTGIDLARIKEFYSRPEQENRLTYMITEEKVINYLIEKSKVTEVPASKLKEASN